MSRSGTPDVRFSPLFDRALAACARAQQLATRCRESQAEARERRASSRHIRTLAAETRTAWAGSSQAFAAMRGQVEFVAFGMRKAGVEHEHAAATVRAHIRYVLYDGGLREQEAEPLVAHATSWVDEVYRAAA
jgi:hypothetical protein